MLPRRTHVVGRAVARKSLPVFSVSQVFGRSLDVEFHVLGLVLRLLVVLVQGRRRHRGVRATVAGLAVLQVRRRVPLPPSLRGLCELQLS